MIDFIKAVEAGEPPTSAEMQAATEYCIGQARTLRWLALATGAMALAIVICLFTVSVPKYQGILLWVLTLTGIMLVLGQIGLMFRAQALADAYSRDMPAVNGPEMLEAVAQVPTGNAYCDAIVQAGRSFRLGEFQAMTQLAKRAHERAAMEKLGCAGGCACR